jgi:hypothetical protein
VNESDWAYTVTPTIQNAPCSYGHPAFPGLYPEDKAVGLVAVAPVVPTAVVKPDDSEYLIRFQSAKPVCVWRKTIPREPDRRSNGCGELLFLAGQE